MNKSKRDLLKGAAVGSAWSVPAVSSIVLPAHAQASPVCVAGPITSSTENTEGVAILFDGEATCSVALFSEPDGGDSEDPDEILLIDNDLVDDDSETFDLDGPTYGANWSNDGPDVESQTAGDYSFTRTRTSGPNSGSQFRIDFTVSFTQPDSMTVSDIMIFRV